MGLAISASVLRLFLDTVEEFIPSALLIGRRMGFRAEVHHLVGVLFVSRPMRQAFTVGISVLAKLVQYELIKSDTL